MTTSSPSAAQALGRASSRLSGVGLDYLGTGGDVQRRSDRKYFVPSVTFERIAAELAADHQVLDIDGRRVFGYLSIYFDTPGLGAYRAHLQRRRKRFKIRTRTYVDSGACMLEMKLAGPRDATIKIRAPYPEDDRGRLSAPALAQLAGWLADVYDATLPEALDVTLTTVYRRATFFSLEEQSRVTCDVGLVCDAEGRTLRVRDDHVLVETKGGPTGSRADRVLRQHGVRPVAVSKYCVGVAAAHPELPSNPWHPTLRRYFEWSGTETTTRALG
jgi:hypothetical protein